MSFDPSRMHALFAQLKALTEKEKGYASPSTIRTRSKTAFDRLQVSMRLCRDGRRVMRRSANIRPGSYYYMLKARKRCFYKLENGIFKRDLFISERMYAYFRSKRAVEYTRKMITDRFYAYFMRKRVAEYALKMKS